MELLLVYLWLKLDSIGWLFVVASLVAIVMAVIYLIAWVSEEDNNTKKVDTGRKTRYDDPVYEIVHVSFWEYLKTSKGYIAFVLMIVFSLINTALPSSKEAAILFGTHYAVKAVESPEGQKVMTLMRKRVNDYLDNEIKAVTQEPTK